MTARPIRRPGRSRELRVLSGHSRLRPVMAPWMVVVLIAVIGFLGLGFARTSLDHAAFELAELERTIAEEQALNQQLKLEIARLESPARIAPLAEELGLVVPERKNQILVDLSPVGPAYASAGRAGETQ